MLDGKMTLINVTDIDVLALFPVDIVVFVSEHFGYSKAEAKRLVKQGAIRVDGKKAERYSHISNGCVFEIGKAHSGVRVRITITGIPQLKAELYEFDTDEEAEAWLKEQNETT